MTATAHRSFWDVFVGEPVQLAKDQPHQVLLSTGSVAIMAQFAASSGIVDPFVGYCIALGVEWAYLRGLASDAQVRSDWGTALNWSAFAVVVLWGCLWCARRFGVIDEHPTGTAGWVLALAHVVPIAWLSLCSAMCHRSAAAALHQATIDHGEAAREAERQAEAERRAFELAEAAKDREVQRWAEAQRLKLELRERSQVSAASVRQLPDSAAGKQTNSVANTNREHLREQVVQVLREQPGANRTELADSLGIGRTTLYKLIKEAQARGELPPAA